MAEKIKRAWMVRAGNDNVLAGEVEERGAIAIGWKDMGNMATLQTRAQFKSRFQEAYPGESPGRIPNKAGQVFRFAREIE